MSSSEEFTDRDLEYILERHEGNALFEQALLQSCSPASLLPVLHRYIQFNSVFGGGVANLAGRLAVRHAVFRDPDDVVEELADRSSEVASTIFYAAIDEFGDPTKSHRVTHRTMAQATLRATAEFLGYSPVALNTLLRPDPATKDSMAQILRGYGVDREMDGSDLFRAIGFHIGSELLADQEFCILDGFLRERHPELVKCLLATAVPVGAARVCAYTWVACHTTVEADHRDAGFAGANRALRFAAAVAPPQRLKEWILEGFGSFSAVQTEFMAGLLTSVIPKGAFQDAFVRDCTSDLN
jgi:hypothetical protein